MVKFLVFIHFLWMPFSSFAMVTTKASEDCPKKFVGKVEQIISATPPLYPRSVDRVILKLVEVLRGEVNEQEEIEVLTYSMLKFNIGENYVLELRKGNICSVVSVNEQQE